MDIHYTIVSTVPEQGALVVEWRCGAHTLRLSHDIPAELLQAGSRAAVLAYIEGAAPVDHLRRLATLPDTPTTLLQELQGMRGTVPADDPSVQTVAEVPLL